MRLNLHGAFLHVNVQKRGCLYPSLRWPGLWGGGSLDPVGTGGGGGGEDSTCRAATRATQAVLAEGQSQTGQRQAVGSASVHGELASVWPGGH